MGGLEKMRPRLSKRYFVELRTGNGTATPKSGPVSLRSDGRQGSKPASRRSARASLRVLDCLPRFGFSPFMGEARSEEHTSELQSRLHLVCRLLLEKKNNIDCYCQRPGAR